MTTLIALLRAVNVGGTGKLPMAELRALCTKAGFRDVRTYLQSGNLVLGSADPAPRVQPTLEKLLTKQLGKPCRVLIRTADELAAVESRNPFPDGMGQSKLKVPFADIGTGRNLNTVRKLVEMARE